MKNEMALAKNSDFTKKIIPLLAYNNTPKITKNIIEKQLKKDVLKQEFFYENSLQIALNNIKKNTFDVKAFLSSLLILSLSTRKDNSLFLWNVYENNGGDYNYKIPMKNANSSYPTYFYILNSNDNHHFIKDYFFLDNYILNGTKNIDLKPLVTHLNNNNSESDMIMYQNLNNSLYKLMNDDEGRFISFIKILQRSELDIPNLFVSFCYYQNQFILDSQIKNFENIFNITINRNDIMKMYVKEKNLDILESLKEELKSDENIYLDNLKQRLEITENAPKLEFEIEPLKRLIIRSEQRLLNKVFENIEIKDKIISRL